MMCVKENVAVQVIRYHFTLITFTRFYNFVIILVFDNQLELEHGYCSRLGGIYFCLLLRRTLVGKCCLGSVIVLFIWRAGVFCRDWPYGSTHIWSENKTLIASFFSCRTISTFIIFGSFLVWMQTFFWIFVGTNEARRCQTGCNCKQQY